MSLLQLKTYSEQTNNTAALYVINAYIQTTEESWTKGKYYLGGQLPLNISESITRDHLNIVGQKNASAGEPCNSWENISMQKSRYEFNIIKELIDSYNKHS